MLSWYILGAMLTYIELYWYILGAMLVICDVNEYRKCVKDFGLPLVTQLFEKLHALCNLLVVVPENLKQVCSGEQLVRFAKMLTLTSIVTNFVCTLP